MSTTTRLTREEKKAQTRRALLDAASVVFARRGYHAASVDEIAAEAGLTTGALYWHFPGKEQLFLALTEEQLAQRADEIREVADAPVTTDALQQAIGEQFESFAARNPDWPLLFFEFWAYAVREPRLRAGFKRQRAAVQGALASALETRATALGISLPLPAEQLAVGIAAMMNGLAFEQVAEPEAVPPTLPGFLLARLVLGMFIPAEVLDSLLSAAREDDG